VQKNKTVVVLFTYGGGMRGIIPARIMSHIEEKTGMRMAEMVDIFTGPSTGAILNAALNVPDKRDPMKPRFKAAHLVRFYEREGIKIFPADRFRDFRGFVHDFNNRTMKLGQLKSLFRHGHYDPAHLSKCLFDLYGDHTIDETLSGLVVPVYNIDGQQLQPHEEYGDTPETPVHSSSNFIAGGGHAVWFKNIPQGRRKVHSHEVRLHDAVLASCAAPTYFPCQHFETICQQTGKPKHISGIDGSIFDNPCISYHGAIRQHYGDDTNIVMIILGTGYTHQSIHKDEWNSYGGLGVVDPVNDLPLITILFHASESALAGSFREEMGDNLFIFNKSMFSSSDPDAKLYTPNKAIDDARPENLERMHLFADKIIDENQAQFDALCRFLERNHHNKHSGQNPLISKVKQLFSS